MKMSYRRYCQRAFGLLATVLAVTTICWFGGSWLGTVEAKLTQANEALIQEAAAFDVNHPKVQAALSAQNRHNPRLLSQPEVVGTATGMDDANEPTVVVYTKRAVPVGAIPPEVDGIPVTVKVTGEIRAMQADIYFPRPVPIGVSVGNRRECSAGTIGARVKDSQGQVYALSNNHVLALENQSPIGTVVAQPGLYDLNCVFSSPYRLGTLYDFEPISFTGSNNIMDAAIALSSKIRLGSATPADGYGKPRAATVAATIGQQVQKYGRTTGLTLGTITGINATWDIDYGEAGLARFVNQIVVTSPTAFIQPGDSGSLLVTNTKKPVGLIFAGSADGRTAIANPINPVLARFGVTIDGRVPPQ